LSKRGHGAVALEPVDAALHGVALLVGLGAERRRPATAGSSALAVADLVGGLGDRRGDATSAQVGTVGPGAVGLVAEHPIGSAPRPTTTRPRNPDGLEHGLELWAVPGLPGGDDQRQRALTLLAGEVELGGQPAA
jgi:hypothetical protein